MATVQPLFPPAPAHDVETMAAVAAALRERSGPNPPAVYDLRIDAPATDDEAALRFAKHQALMRSYQGRFVLLPSEAPEGSIVARLHRHYDRGAMARVDALRDDLEGELIEPLVLEAAAVARSVDPLAYVADVLPRVKRAPPSAFLAFLEATPHREHHYRNFLIQSSADLLAEASASALGVIGEFGEPQSALFRILIDEFGYGVHDKKHSVLYRRCIDGFGLNTEYNGYWSLFDERALELHNVIHSMFQTPAHFFRQVGFLLYAETSYQHSTGEHFRYLKRFHPAVDGTYFGEHAHIDLHHTAMVTDEVVRPLIARFGEEAGREIVLGAELTALTFARSERHLLALGEAFEAAAARGDARFGMREPDAEPGPVATPASGDGRDGGRDGGSLQIGGIGVVTDPAALARFPEGTIGRAVRP